MLSSKWLAAAALVASPLMIGCGGHTARTAKMRSALDAGDPKLAIAELDEELDVKSEKEMPKKVEGDDALLVLDRASLQQGLLHFDLAEADFQAADKAIDMLDLAHNAADSIGEYVFSGSSGKYVAPPYEKLMLNTLNMLDYLEQHDLSGAKVEARRLSVMQKYYKDQLNQPNSPVLGLGSMLAGFAFEKSGDADEAMRYYDEALEFSGASVLGDAVRRLSKSSSYRSPRLEKVIAAEKAEDPKPDEETGEVLFVVGFGRVAHKISNRVPIGLALTLVSGDIAPNDRARANELAAKGLVTWVNFPSLGEPRGAGETPGVKLDGKFIGLEEAVDVDREVRAEWKKIEGKIILSAITRMIARLAVGEGIQTAAGRKNVVGLLGGLAAEATLAALDTPDTRSWETLPARVAVARVRLPVGRHAIEIDARGWHRTQQVDVTKGSWSVVSLMALR